MQGLNQQKSGVIATLSPLLLVAGAGISGAVVLFLARYDAHLVLYAALVGALFTGTLVYWLRRTTLANPLLMAAVVLAMFAIMDVAVGTVLATPGASVRTTVDGQEHVFYLRDPELGYVPRPNTIAEAEKSQGERIIYRVRYSTDEHGFRLTHSSADQRADTVVFVGCSVTFGDGINDQDTLPERFSALKGGQYRVVNAGFSGYGTHQVLRELETGRFDGNLGTGKRLFIYTAIAEHLPRIAGQSDWDVWGPAYRLDGDSVRWVGHFHSNFTGNLLRLIQRDPLLTLVRNAWPQAAGDDPVALFAALARQARDTAKAHYGADFVVLLYDISPPDAEPAARVARERMGQALAQVGVPFIRLSALVPDYLARTGDYQIPGDGHPTGALNQRLATELARLY